jgi:hypothetical protein
MRTLISKKQIAARHKNPVAAVDGTTVIHTYPSMINAPLYITRYILTMTVDKAYSSGHVISLPVAKG